MNVSLVEVAEIEDGVLELTLCAPPLNLMMMTLTAELDAMLDRLAACEDVRVLVVTGAGPRAFCAGSDIKEFNELAATGTAVDRKVRFENLVYTKLADFPRPTIAKIRGAALGGGLELAACCDFLIAAEDATLGLPEVKIGVFPGSGGTFRVARRIGEARAKELMLFGEPIDAAQACEWGLVNWVVPAEALDDAMRQKARALAALPNRSLELCKRAIHLTHIEEETITSRTVTLQDAVFATEDCREGARAFLAKTPPQYTHR